MTKGKVTTEKKQQKRNGYYPIEVYKENVQDIDTIVEKLKQVPVSKGLPRNRAKVAADFFKQYFAVYASSIEAQIQTAVSQ